MEKRIELLQEGYAAQNDRRAHKRRREEEAEGSKVTSSSMNKRLEEQQSRVETLQTDNSKLQFNLSSVNTENKQLKTQLAERAEKEKEFAAEIQRLKLQLKEVGNGEWRESEEGNSRRVWRCRRRW